MPELAPIFQAFEALAADDRFERLDLEFRRSASSGSRFTPEFIITVKGFPTGSLDAHTALSAALAEFAQAHDLDSQMEPFWLKLTPRA
jgi:hypothetical protein